MQGRLGELQTCRSQEGKSSGPGDGHQDPNRGQDVRTLRTSLPPSASPLPSLLLSGNEFMVIP